MSYGTSKPQKNRGTEESNSFPLLLKSTMIGIGGALLCGTALLFLSALLCYLSDDPHKMMLPLGLAVLYLSALLGGIFTVRRHGHSALLCGTLCGVLLMLFFWLLHIFFKDTSSNFSFPITILLRSALPVTSILGAFLGLNRTTKRPRRTR